MSTRYNPPGSNQGSPYSPSVNVSNQFQPGVGVYVPPASTVYTPPPPPGSTNPHDPNFDPTINRPGGDVRGGMTKAELEILIGDRDKEVQRSNYGLYDFDFGDKAALKSLFRDLNRVSLRDLRAGGGGSGGGSEPLSGNMDANQLISLNPYLDENVTSFGHGGTYSGAELPENFNLFQAREGTYKGFEPGTAVYNEFVRQGVIPKGETYFDSRTGKYYQVEKPSSINRTAMSRYDYDKGGMYNPYNPPKYILGGLVKNIMGGAANLIGSVLDPINEYIVSPVFNTAGDIVEGFTDALIPNPNINIPEPVEEEIQREAVKKTEPQVFDLMPTDSTKPVRIKSDEEVTKTLPQGDFVGNKPNPYVTANVDEELDYQGMKMSQIGGQMFDPLSKSEMFGHGGHYMKQANQAVAMNQLSGLVANALNKRGIKMAKGGTFKPHMMYDPKTGKGYMANKLQDHLDMKKKGYDHRKRNPKNYPKSAKGMKMKSYTNGGRL